MERIYTVIPIEIEKIWGKPHNKKNIGEIIKFEINKEQSNKLLSFTGNKYNLFELYNDTQKKLVFFGKKYIKKTKFPFLIKYIYSGKRLSLQVHPKEKNEYWYFLGNDQSKIILGLKETCDNHSSCEDIISKVNYIDVLKNMFVKVRAGTIHSILENNVVCEIQDNCDITYRIFDWDNNRELTVSEFNKCANFNITRLKKIVSNNFKKFKDKNYKIKKLIINNKSTIKSHNSCLTIIVISGNGILQSDNEIFNLEKDMTMFLIPNTKCIVSGKIECILVK